MPLFDAVLEFLGTVLTFVIGIYVYRLMYLLTKRRPTAPLHQNRSRLPTKTVIVMGSGGHTMEMSNLVGTLNPANYQPRVYIVAATDKMSLSKVEKMEEQFRRKPGNLHDYQVITIPRSREVGQSYFSSIFTTLHSSFYSFYHVLRISPELVICNGPGTCVPICFAVFLLKLFTFSDSTMIYIESICRVKSLSLSGKILIWIVDYLIVQWPELALKYPRAHYIGYLL